MIIYYHCKRDSALLLPFLLTGLSYIHPFSFHEMIFIQIIRIPVARKVYLEHSMMQEKAA